jgi:hypothetical protein
MPGDIEISANTLNIQRAFSAWPDKMATESISVLRLEGGRYISALQRDRMRGGTTPDRLAVRTGMLRRSFKHTVVGTNLNSIALVITSGAKYANIQEHGGVVKAKPGKALAIPLAPAKTAAGVARWTGPRDPEAPPMFMLKTGGAPLLVGSGKSEGMLIPYYILLKSVRIPPRLGARITMENRLPLIIKGLAAAAGKVWRDKTGAELI